MREKIQTVFGLHKERKVHKKLIIRLGMFAVLTVVFFGIALYDVLLRGLPWIPMLVITVLGFLFGRYFVVKMMKISWSETEQIITVNRIDRAGFGILIIYILVRLSTHWLLEHIYHDVLLISGLTLSSIFGVFLGRLSGMLSHIIKVQRPRRE